MEHIVAFLAGLLTGAAVAWLLVCARLEVRYQQARAEFEPQRAALGERMEAERRARIEAEAAAGRARARADTLTDEKEAEAVQRAASQSMAARVPGLEAEVSELRTRLDKVTLERAALVEQLGQLEQSTQEKLALLENAREKLLEAFKALSGEALKSNNQAFIELAKASFDKFQDSAQAARPQSRTGGR